MNFNFLEFVNTVLMIMKRTPVTSFSSTVNADEYRARTAVNSAVQDLSLLLRIKSRMTTFTITTVAAQRTYTIQKRIMYPFGNLRQKTSDLIIQPMNPMIFDLFIPDDQSSGSPQVHYFEEYSGVSNQPATAGEVVYCVSDSGSDGGTVVIQGYDASGNYVADEVTLSGTSAVASTSTFTKIDSISKLATTGTITFRNSGSTTTYLTLSPKETHARLVTIGLHPVPNAAITVYGRGWIQIPPMVNEYDVPVGLSYNHINAITAGSIFQFMKYDPAFKRENLAGLKDDYYDEVNKIIGQDADDRVPHAMRSPYQNIRAGVLFSPLDRRTP